MSTASSWQAPKTDWAIHLSEDGKYTGDYFASTDFNRIAGNLSYLGEQARALFGAGAISAGDIAQVDAAAFLYASMVNALEAGVQAVAAAPPIPMVDVPAAKSWAGNESAPRAEDWNRLESACLSLKAYFDRIEACIPRLSFSLGGGLF